MKIALKLELSVWSPEVLSQSQAFGRGPLFPQELEDSSCLLKGRFPHLWQEEPVALPLV